MHYFKDIPKGLFWYRGLVYSKFSETQAVLITMGEVKDFNPMDEVELI